jgi:ankyrin repeat protein
MAKIGTISLVLVILCIIASLSEAGEIHDAAYWGDIERLEKLLKKDPLLVNSRASGYMPGYFEVLPLHYAVVNDQKEAVKFLIKKGADVNGMIEATRHLLTWRCPMAIA